MVGVADAIDSRHNLSPKDGYWKKRPRCSLSRNQKPGPSAAGSPPNPCLAADNAASLPESRAKVQLSSYAKADHGQGWPHHRFIVLSASSGFMRKTKVVSHSGLGITLSETSSSTPRVPLAPTISRERSKPATFFITCPPNESTYPLPLISLQPSTLSRAEPAKGRRGPDKPQATVPPKVASAPK